MVLEMGLLRIIFQIDVGSLHEARVSTDRDQKPLVEITTEVRLGYAGQDQLFRHVHELWLNSNNNTVGGTTAY